MQNNQFPYWSDEMGERDRNNPYASGSGSSFDGLFPPCAKLPFHGVELQPSAVCPRNFVIFDQTYDRSQVMYHPDLTHKLMSSPSLNGLATTFQNEYVGESYGNFEQGGVSTSHQEDPNEIDALLSTDEDYEDDDDEDEKGDSEEVSTTRNSSRDYGNNSAESCCSSYGYNKSSKKKQSKSLSGSASCNNNDGKGRKKMKKMMGVLRRIVPGGEEMNTASVLDEAVQYLKSLKIEAQKLGVGHFSNQS
ncbi:unnamed protein product [Microthlaspi erraticum]|uniref:BHLH domain-containing protein n=1 Tax=Microthlaspi erraticum TaxID=1685480 RepID=A0A6D2L8T9_9BRAS|nr:unnamed protein product [Microthlaspi erraticum]